MNQLMDKLKKKILDKILNNNNKFIIKNKQIKI